MLKSQHVVLQAGRRARAQRRTQTWDELLLVDLSEAAVCELLEELEVEPRAVPADASCAERR